MGDFAGRRSRVRLTILAAWVGLALALPAAGQVSPEEHKKHHPVQDKAGQPEGKMGGGMMEGMGKAPTKELYPSLMSLPELTPERHEEILAQAQARMREGTALLSKGVDRMTQGAEAGDSTAMQEGLVQVREGLSRLESGLAARIAVKEGAAPRDVALQWFRREMNLPTPSGAASHGGVLGLSWFHFFVMLILIGFAAAMLWMYFHKMRRASRLLQNLTGGTPPVAGAGAAVGASPAPTTLADVRLAALTAPMAAETGAAAGPGPWKLSRWSGKLRVGRIFSETPNVKTFRLMNPLGGVLPFGFLPGQFLTVTVVADGKPVKRSYTIASSATQHDYAELTVKHEEGGSVSGFFHTHIKQGDLLACSGPSGTFIFTGRECDCILLIGGGVGVTPMMSVLRYLLDRNWDGDIFLLYTCRTPADIIFREELDYLQRRHKNLKVVVTISRPEGTDWKGPTGRITKELIMQSVPDLPRRYVHICGPVPMMEATKQMLAELGMRRERIKVEAFGPAAGKVERMLMPQAAAGHKTAEEAPAIALPTVTFSKSEKSAPLPRDKVILEVAEENGVDIDYSCRVGTCGVCRVKLTFGEVTMNVEEGLQPGDKEKHIILACQARSKGDVSVEA